MGYDVMRADEIAAPNSINRGIVEHLEDSDLVVADIHDHNPNVFYELGIRNVVNKPTILFKQKNGHPPFDIQEKRAINHPFPKIGSEYGEEIRQKYENDIDRAIKELKDHADAAEKNPTAASESIASNYLKIEEKIKELGKSLDFEKSKLKKQKKNLRFSVILSAIIVTGILSFLTFSIIEHDITTQNMIITHDDKMKKASLNNWNHGLDEQSRQIESDVYDHFNTVIFSTLELKTQLKYFYDVGPTLFNSSHPTTPSEFIEKIRNHGNYMGIFEKDFTTTPISAYVYVMEHGDPCTFVTYAHLDTMVREGIGRELKSCTFMDNHEFIIADIHASTGTVDYSFATVANVDLELNDGKVDLIVSTAIDLVRLSEKIKTNIHIDDVRYVLENRYDEIVFDCMKEECPLDYKTKALDENENDEFDKYSQPLTYNLGDFPGYYEHENIELDNNRLDKIPRNSILLEGWTLHVLLPKDDP